MLADQEEAEGEGAAAAAGDEDEEEEYVYNPLKLPLGFDGKPIPYWLYKLHGLNQEFKCEICGNYRCACACVGGQGANLCGHRGTRLRLCRRRFCRSLSRELQPHCI